MTDGGMDQEKLAALFRAAASDTGAPPPSFDHDDVVAASRRIGARRARIAAGAAGLVVVAGIGAAVVLPNTLSSSSSTSAAAPYAASEAPGAAEKAAPDAAAPRAVAPQIASGGGYLGPGKSECANRQDPELRMLVDQALPVAGAPQAAITMECRPGGERGVNLEVQDAGRSGVLTVEYLPPGVAQDRIADGASRAERPTGSGGTVIVSVRPAEPGSAPPFADRVDAAAAYLAPLL
jgi:hypothetical protein